jgi:hypothetical protein
MLLHCLYSPSLLKFCSWVWNLTLCRFRLQRAVDFRRRSAGLQSFPYPGVFAWQLVQALSQSCSTPAFWSHTQTHLWVLPSSGSWRGLLTHDQSCFQTQRATRPEYFVVLHDYRFLLHRVLWRLLLSTDFAKAWLVGPFDDPCLSIPLSSFFDSWTRLPFSVPLLPHSHLNSCHWSHPKKNLEVIKEFSNELHWCVCAS